MFQAVKERASDIHIEPREKDLIVRYRAEVLVAGAAAFVPKLAAGTELVAAVRCAWADAL